MKLRKTPKKIRVKKEKVKKAKVGFTDANFSLKSNSLFYLIVILL